MSEFNIGRTAPENGEVARAKEDVINILRSHDPEESFALVDKYGLVREPQVLAAAQEAYEYLLGDSYLENVALKIKDKFGLPDRPDPVDHGPIAESDIDTLLTHEQDERIRSHNQAEKIFGKEVVNKDYEGGLEQ